MKLDHDYCDSYSEDDAKKWIGATIIDIHIWGGGSVLVEKDGKKAIFTASEWSNYRGDSGPELDIEEENE